MFFNRKEATEPRRPTRPARPPARREATPLSPRFARLVRESWWLVIVAAFIWLALILATYTRTDQGWSFSGTGAPIGNRGGIAGAWLADLLLYLFGLSAWWWVVAGVVLVVAGYRRIGRPELASDHPLPLAILGFALVLLTSAALEGLRFTELPVALPQGPGGALGDLVGAILAQAVGGDRGEAAAGRAVRRRLLAVLRCVVAEADGAARWRRGDGVHVAAPPRRRARRSPARRAGAGRARGGLRAGEAGGARARADPGRAGAAGGAEVGARWPGSDSGRCSASCPILRCRRSTCSRRRPRCRTPSAPTRWSSLRG